MNPMATDDRHDSLGRYSPRPIRGHGVVRAVWTREAGALSGSTVRVVARTFSSVVLHIDEAVHGAGGVEVRPAGRCSPGTLTSSAVGFDAHPWVTPAQLAALELAVRAARPDDAAARLVPTVLARCDQPRRDDDVTALATALEAAPDRATMSAVADRVLVSGRTLRRRFTATVGMSADRYRVVARVARARHELVATSTPLAVLAWQLGFADQSHLHRDVIELSGSTPTAWRERGRAWHVA